MKPWGVKSRARASFAIRFFTSSGTLSETAMADSLYHKWNTIIVDASRRAVKPARNRRRVAVDARGAQVLRDVPAADGDARRPPMATNPPSAREPPRREPRRA
jgi:hypothetical protein